MLWDLSRSLLYNIAPLGQEEYLALKSFFVTDNSLGFAGGTIVKNLPADARGSG